MYKHEGELPRAKTIDDKHCGHVKFSFNHEAEIKTALVTPRPELAKQITDDFWGIYVAEKTAEWAKSFDRHRIPRAKGPPIIPPLSMQNKPYRRREFFTMLDGHPRSVEIRGEDMTTMIKLALHHPNAHVLHRIEVKIGQQFPGIVDFADIPGDIGDYLADHFKDPEDRFAGAASESTRDKLTIPTPYDWKRKAYVFDYERAKDLGSITSLAGHFRDVTEFEGEVKAIYDYEGYMRGHKVDLKKSPEYGDLSHDDIHTMSETFLRQRLRSFVDFFNQWADASKYQGTKVEPVVHSKSQPEMDALRDLIESGGRPARQIIKKVPRNEPFTVNPALNAMRLRMAA